MLQHPTFLTLFQFNDAMKRHKAYFFNDIFIEYHFTCIVDISIKLRRSEEILIYLNYAKVKN